MELVGCCAVCPLAGAVVECAADGAAEVGRRLACAAEGDAAEVGRKNGE